MEDVIYQMYRLTRELIDHPEKGTTEEKLNKLSGFKLDLSMVEEKCPQYKKRYECEKSFTPEQIDHICYQIGEWYLTMKPLLQGQHNLGYMKERLKIMIVGDEI